jgi:hypothetical protein
MLAGHIDEIGLMVNYISAEGFISVAGIGGVDPNVLPGTRVNVHTKDGVLLGLVGRKPIHLLEDDEPVRLVRVHAFRPFPAAAVVRARSSTQQSVAGVTSVPPRPPTNSASCSSPRRSPMSRRRRSCSRSPRAATN